MVSWRAGGASRCRLRRGEVNVEARSGHHLSDTKHTPPSADEADVEREVRLGWKFSLSDAIGRMGGKGLLKGESPGAPKRQTEGESADYLRAHLQESGGVLAGGVLRHVRTSEGLLTNFDQPMGVLVSSVTHVLQSEALLTELVREADADWGRAYGARPYFARDGHRPHPEDPYTLAAGRDALRPLLARATRDEE